MRIVATICSKTGGILRQNDAANRYRQFKNSAKQPSKRAESLIRQAQTATK
jgi:hypothetical protein